MTEPRQVAYNVLYQDKDYFLADVPIKLIDVPKERFSSVQDDRTASALVSSLNNLPLINEIGLVKDKSRFTLLYGGARVEVLKGLGKEVVRAKVWMVEPDKALFMQLAENAARGGYSKAQLLDYAVKLVESKKYKAKEIAQLIHVDASQMSKLKSISTLDPRLKETFLDKNVAVDTMYELRLLPNVESQIAALDSIIKSGYDKKAARYFIRYSLAGYCDNCCTTSHDRNEWSGVKLYGEHGYLCVQCKPLETDINEGVQVDQEQQLLPGTPPAPWDTSIQFWKCPNCEQTTALSQVEQTICSACFSRFQALQAAALQGVGQRYWDMKDKEVAKLKVSA